MSSHGSSKFISNGVKLIAEAEFYRFAPCPCVCCMCCTNSSQQARTYFQIWDNRIEANYPCAIFGCMTCGESCVIDRISVKYFDRPPIRTGNICCCIPARCFGGPPVIYNRIPTCCYGYCDMSWMFGEGIMIAPSDCCDWKQPFTCSYIYECFSCSILSGVKNSINLVQEWEKAVENYRILHGLGEQEMANFRCKLTRKEKERIAATENLSV